MHTCTPAHLHTCTPAHLHTCTLAHLHTCTLAHLHTCTPGSKVLGDLAGCSYCGGLGHRITACPKLESVNNKKAGEVGVHITIIVLLIFLILMIYPPVARWARGTTSPTRPRTTDSPPCTCSSCSCLFFVSSATSDSSTIRELQTDDVLPGPGR